MTINDLVLYDPDLRRKKNRVFSPKKEEKRDTVQICTVALKNAWSNNAEVLKLKFPNFGTSDYCTVNSLKIFFKKKKEFAIHSTYSTQCTVMLHTCHLCAQKSWCTCTGK